MKKEGRGRRNILFTALLAGLLLAFQEVLFRACIPVPEVLNFNRIHYSKIALNEAMRSAETLSNTAFTWASDPDGVEFVTTLNIYGFRGNDFTLKGKGGSPRVMFVGDSFTEGFMAADGWTMPDAFAERAGELGRPVEVLNLGVGAAGLEQYVKIIRDAVPLFRPDDVVLVLYANDLPPRSYDPAWIDGPLQPELANPWKPRLVHVLQRMADGQPLAFRWTSGTFSFLSAVPDPANPWSRPEKAAMLERIVAPSIAQAMRRGRFNPHAVNEYDMLGERLILPAGTSAILGVLSDYAGRHDARLLVVYLPGRDQVSDEYLRYGAQYTATAEPTSRTGPEYQRHAAAVRKDCDALQIPFYDLTGDLRAAETAGRRLFWRYDSHMNEQGYRLAGRTLHDWRGGLVEGPGPDAPGTPGG